jgi:hypothetical protein
MYMKCTKLLERAVVFSLLAVIFSACQKVKTAIPLADGGKTLVKFVNGGQNKPGGTPDSVELEPNSSVSVPVRMADVRRDVTSNAELNKVMYVEVENKPGLVKSYYGNLEVLPEAAYTIGAETPLVGSKYKVTIKAGEIAQGITINVKSQTLQPGKSYGLGFTLVSADADGLLSVYRNVVGVVKVREIRNQWDGIYSVSGTFFHPTLPELVGPFGTPTSGGNIFCSLITSGPTSLRRSYGNVVGESVVVFNSNLGSFQRFTGVQPRFSIDPLTNLVTLSAVPGTIDFDPTPYDCKYDPDTRTFTLNYAWTSGGQRRITEVLTYVLARPK